MSALTNLERQHRKIERERAAGLVRRTVTIPEKRDQELKAIVAKWVEEDTERGDP
jgi:hypothetical protein